MNKKLSVIITVVIVIGAGYLLMNQKPEAVVTNFEECVAAGNPVMESYPRQCRHNDQTFTESEGGPNSLPTKATLEVIKQAAEKAGVSKESVTVVSNIPKEWSDGCLGLGGPDEGCLAAITPGYEITVNVNGAEQVYRTDEGGMQIRRERVVIACTSRQKSAEFCTKEYSPVCAKVNVQCVTAPCDPVSETFSNACQACQNPLVESYVAGECK